MFGLVLASRAVKEITIAWGSGLLKGGKTLLVASKNEKAEMKLSLAYAKQKQGLKLEPTVGIDRLLARYQLLI